MTPIKFLKTNKMKKTIITSLLLFLGIFTINAQQTWTVSNNGAFDADYDNLWDCIDTANAGDIIYIQGSSASYSSTGSQPDSIKKAVLIFGPGYLLSENDNSYQYNNSTVKFTKELRFTAEGAFVSGLQLQGGVRVYTNNLVLERNYILWIQLYDSNNIGLLQNFIYSSFSIWGGVTANGNCNNLLALGNVFSSTGYSIQVSSGASISGLVKNNTFVGPIYMTDSVFENNIFLSNPPSTSGNGSSFFSNIFTTNVTALDGVNNNQVDVDASTLFVGAEGNSTDGQYQVADGSAADNAGTDGTDCGAFGGDEPYVLSGIPAIPQIYDLQTPTSTNGDDLEVEVKVRTNN